MRGEGGVGGVASSKGGMGRERGRGQGEQQGGAGAEHSHSLNLQRESYQEINSVPQPSIFYRCLQVKSFFLVTSFHYLGEPSGSARLMRRRVGLAVLPVLLRVPVYRGLAAPHLQASGHLPGLLGGAPAPLALPAVAFQPAELA